MNKAYILQHNTTSTKTSSCHLIHLLDRYPPKDSPEALDEKGALLRIRSDLKSALKASNPNPFTKSSHPLQFSVAALEDATFHCPSIRRSPFCGFVPHHAGIKEGHHLQDQQTGNTCSVIRTIEGIQQSG